MRLTIRPLTEWTGARTPASRRKAHNFTRQHPTNRWGRQDIPWTETLVLLDRELVALDAHSVVLQIQVTERDIRLDGQLRADARPSDPAVRILFDSKHGPLTYQCDRFATWQDNARAIALGLEALRKVERYGITEHGEQYKGWLAIEAGPSGREPMTRDDAAALIERVAGYVPLGGAQTLNSVYRQARAKAHPDRNDGDRTLWDQVEDAARILGLEG